ncbi:FUSC family protein [Shewanella canadensis]|nr:FUSC family protein [Shewanella canadensis]
MVPALYVANELYRQVDSGHEQVLYKYILYFPLLALPTLIFATGLSYLDKRPLLRFDKLWQFDSNINKVVETWLTAVAVFFSVGLTILIAEYYSIGHYEWIVWSAVSVSTGESIAMKKKVKHRILGTIVAVGFACTLSYHSIEYEFLGFLSVLLIPATVTLNNYFFAFTLRSFLTVFAASSIDFSVEKLVAVISGCIIGYSLALFMAQVHNKWMNEKKVQQ